MATPVSVQDVKAHLSRLPALLQYAMARHLCLAGPNWLTGVCHRHQLDGKSHCNPQRHGTASFTDSRIYAAMSH